MKNLIFTFFLAITVSIGFSQNTDFSYQEKFFVNGKPKADNKEENGVKVGKWVEYLNSDSLPQADLKGATYIRLSEFKAGKEVEKVFVLYKSMRVYSITSFSSKNPGVKHGKSSWFHPNGGTMRTCYYKNGKLDGLETIFGARERVSVEQYYADDKLNGPQTTYYANGKVLSVYEYYDGVLDLKKGTHKVYYPNGELEWLYQYDPITGTGSTKHFDEDTILLEETNIVE